MPVDAVIARLADRTIDNKTAFIFVLTIWVSKEFDTQVVNSCPQVRTTSYLLRRCVLSWLQVDEISSVVAADLRSFVNRTRCFRTRLLFRRDRRSLHRPGF